MAWLCRSRHADSVQHQQYVNTLPSFCGLTHVAIKPQSFLSNLFAALIEKRDDKDLSLASEALVPDDRPRDTR